MKLEWTPRARAERTDDIDYIAQDNPSAALSQLDRIEYQTDMLIQHPEIGRAGRKQGTRELVISHTPFIVIYRIKGECIEVMRLLRGLQQWPTLKN